MRSTLARSAEPPSRALRVAVFLIACLALQACTLIGSGIGLGVVLIVPGPYEQRQAVAPTGMTRERFLSEVRPSKGDRLRLKLTSGRALAGEYGGFVVVESQGLRRRDGERATAAESESEIWLETPERVRVSLSEIVSAELDAELIGYNWLIGTAIGASLDAFVIVGLAALRGTPL
jgi:hypothetical protein